MNRLEGVPAVRGLRIALVVARFNDFVTERLEAGAIDALTAAGLAPDDITVVKVPGSFEIPLTAQRLAETGRVDAVVCLGCLIKGATAHFEYIASAVSHGITQAAAATGIPCTFGVLTTASAEEALERAGKGSANKGFEAAMAAVEMASLLKRLAQADASGIRV